MDRSSLHSALYSAGLHGGLALVGVLWLQSAPVTSSSWALKPRVALMAELEGEGPRVKTQTKVKPLRSSSNSVGMVQPKGQAGQNRGPESSAAMNANPSGPVLELKPRYPRRSRSLGEEGEVLIRVELLESGQLSRATVVRSSGFYRLDEAALQAVREANFPQGSRSRDLRIVFRLAEGNEQP